MQVLSALPKQDDPRLLVDTSHFDDAGVAAVTPELALVQTVDFFPPVVDDPWWFGRIAAANALSDCYAMGGKPFSALNIVAFPTGELPLEVLRTILEGGSHALQEAGALMLGGHSIVDTGIKYGLAVTGTLRPGTQVTNAGAQTGDLLYLTKPLGTGCLTTGARKDKVSDEHLSAACESMGRLNAAACEAMLCACASTPRRCRCWPARGRRWSAGWPWAARRARWRTSARGWPSTQGWTPCCSAWPRTARPRAACCCPSRPRAPRRWKARSCAAAYWRSAWARPATPCRAARCG